MTVKIEIECESCKQKFLRYPSQVNNHNFCSRKCHFTVLRPNPAKEKIRLVCSHCLNDYFTSPYRAKTSSYCSRRCMYAELVKRKGWHHKGRKIQYDANLDV